MDDRREQLMQRLERHYRRSGWKVRRSKDGTVLATGPSGVTWIGAAILSADLDGEDFDTRLIELTDRRMADGGELCPVDLLPDDGCEAELRGVLSRLGLGRRPHVSVYSVAA